MSKTNQSPATIPLLRGHPLDRDHLDRIHAWLAQSPTPAEVRELQAELVAWSPAQRGLGAPSGLEGLWRTTRVIRTSGELEDPADDDIEACEAADDPPLDGQSTWCDDLERLFYFLEIRGCTFRELDASVYPVVSRTHTFDHEVVDFTPVEESDECKAGAVYHEWEWAIDAGPDGFAPIAEATLKKSRRSKRPTAAFLLNYRDDDAVLIDRLHRPSADVLERRVFILAEGVYTYSIRCTYERFAAPLVGADERAGAAAIDLAIEGPKSAKPRAAKRAPRPA